MAPPLDVCIRGAGIVGHSLALLLAHAGLRVGLVRQVASRIGTNDVRAYALNAASMELLESLRIRPQASEATAVLAIEVNGDDGGQLHFSAQQQKVAALAWIVEAAALQQQLVQVVSYQPLIELLETPQPAALTVISEGKNSSSRADLGIEFNVTPYPQQAIAAQLVCEKPHGQVARQWFADGEILALLPRGETAAGEHSVALIWSVDQKRAANLSALDHTAFAQQLEAASHFRLGQLGLISERASWPLQLGLANRWCAPGWVLVGDAAHTIHPLAGQGLNLGLADAKVLAQVLHEREQWRALGDVRLLRRFERARKVDVLAMGALTDGLQRLFAQPGQPWTLLRNWGMDSFNHSGPLKRWVAQQAMD